MRLVASLRATRRRLGLRQEDVARRLGVARTWLTKVEQREIRLDVVQLVRLARVYGVRAHELVRNVEEELSEGDSSSLRPLFCLQTALGTGPSAHCTTFSWGTLLSRACGRRGGRDAGGGSGTAPS